MPNIPSLKTHSAVLDIAYPSCLFLERIYPWEAVTHSSVISHFLWAILQGRNNLTTMNSTRELCWGIGEGGIEPGRRGLGKAKGETQTWFSYILAFPEARPPSECAGVRLVTKSFADLIFQSFEARCPGKDVSSMPWSLTNNVTQWSPSFSLHQSRYLVSIWYIQLAGSLASISAPRWLLLQLPRWPFGRKPRA